MDRRRGGERQSRQAWHVIAWLVVAALLLPTWLRPGPAAARDIGLLDEDEGAPIYSPAANQTVLPLTDVNVELGSFTDPSGGGPWAVVVNWGDGTSDSTFQMPIVADLGAQPHRWTYGGVYTVTVKVTDDFPGASDTGSFTVTVGSTVPDVPTNVAATPGNASATVIWGPPFTDGGSPIDYYTVSIQPTAGGAGQTQPVTDLSALTATFTGLTNGTQYTATVRAHNALGDGAKVTTTMTPEAPILAITALGTTTLPEGSAAFDLGVTGTGFAEGMTVRWNGDDRPTSFVSETELTAQIAAADVADSGSASVTVHDGVGNVTTNALTLTITNVAPSATFEAPASMAAGAPIALALTGATDPSPADTTAGFTYAFDCGTGSGYGAFGAASTASCPTSAAGQRTVKGTVRDQDGGEREYTATVQVVALPAATLVVAAAGGPYNGTAALSATLTLDGEPLAGKTVAFTLVGAAAGSATSDDSGIASIPTASLAGITVGTYPSGVAASFAGDGTATAENGTAALTVTKANQTITFDTLPDRALGSGTFEVSATASSGLAVAFFASGNCTIDGTTVTLVALGGCTITASQTGDVNYNYAPDMVRSFEIVPPASGLTAQAATGTYGGTTTLAATLLDDDDQPLAGKSIVFTIDGGLVGSATTAEDGVATLPNVSLDGISAGSHPGAIGASFAGDADFAESEDTAALTITQAALTVTAEDKSRAVGAADPAFTATYDGFVDEETVADLGGALDCTTTATGASGPGTYAINCAGLTSGNYAIAYVAGTLTVVVGDSATAADDVMVTYGAANATLTATVTADVAVNEGTITFTVKRGGTTLGSATSGTLANGEASAIFSLAGLAAGDYTIVADYSGGATVTASSDTATLTVARAALTVTAHNATRPYGAANPAFTVAYGGFVNGDDTGDLTGTLTCTTTATPASAPGGYSIACAGLTAESYAIAYVDGTLTVTKADQQITFGALADRQLSASPFAVSASASSGLAVGFAASGGACTVAGTSVTLTGLGTCTITASQAGNTNYNAAASVAHSFLVTTDPPAQVTLALTVVGIGVVFVAPPGTSSSGGDFSFNPGDPVRLTSVAGEGQTFTGWAVDGVATGWAMSISITMNGSHAVQAQFVATTTFPDVDSTRDDYPAIVALATRGTILGYLDGRFGPDDPVSRAQMAALIARATPGGPGTPTNGTLTPPGCVMPNSWNCEDWGNNFVDQDGLDGNLWRDVGTLQHYGVAGGYDGVHFGPNDPVTYAQTIAFITRAMVAKGYWQWQPDGPRPPDGVPAGHDQDVRTFLYYVGSLPALPQDEGWNDGATRGWFAEALWAALDSYWGTDDLLRDGRPAGGYVP